MGYDLRLDLKEPSSFRITDDESYWVNPLTQEKMVAFDMTSYRISLGWDSKNSFDEIEFTLELFEAGLLFDTGMNSASKVSSPLIAFTMTFIGIIIFVAFLVPFAVKSKAKDILGILYPNLAERVYKVPEEEVEMK